MTPLKREHAFFQVKSVELGGAPKSGKLQTGLLYENCYFWAVVGYPPRAIHTHTHGIQRGDTHTHTDFHVFRPGPESRHEATHTHTHTRISAFFAPAGLENRHRATHTRTYTHIYTDSTFARRINTKLSWFVLLVRNEHNDNYNLEQGTTQYNTKQHSITDNNVTTHITAPATNV